MDKFALRLFTFGLIIMVAISGIATITYRIAHYTSDLAFWQDTVTRDPHNYSALSMLALSYDDAGDTKRAEDTYRTILHVEPDSAFARLKLGHILYRQGKHSEAHQLWKLVDRSSSTSLKKSAELALQNYP